MNAPSEDKLAALRNSAPHASEVLTNEIEQLWGLQIAILDEIDDQIEAVEDMGAETHFLETRAEELRDEIGSTFSRLRNAGNNDMAWERAFLQAGALYENLRQLPRSRFRRSDADRRSGRGSGGGPATGISSLERH
jgi:hypothetical protein